MCMYVCVNTLVYIYSTYIRTYTSRYACTKVHTIKICTYVKNVVQDIVHAHVHGELNHHQIRTIRHTPHSASVDMDTAESFVEKYSLIYQMGLNFRRMYFLCRFWLLAIFIF